MNVDNNLRTIAPSTQRRRFAECNAPLHLQLLSFYDRAPRATICHRTATFTFGAPDRLGERGLGRRRVLCGSAAALLPGRGGRGRDGLRRGGLFQRGPGRGGRPLRREALDLPVGETV